MASQRVQELIQSLVSAKETHQSAVEEHSKLTSQKNSLLILVDEINKQLEEMTKKKSELETIFGERVKAVESEITETRAGIAHYSNINGDLSNVIEVAEASISTNKAKLGSIKIEVDLLETDIEAMNGIRKSSQ